MEKARVQYDAYRMWLKVALLPSQSSWKDVEGDRARKPEKYEKISQHCSAAQQILAWSSFP
jgi:hypothetical protein